MILQSAKFIGAGLATIAFAGSGVGIGIVFAALINSFQDNEESTWVILEENSSTPVIYEPNRWANIPDNSSMTLRLNKVNASIMNLNLNEMENKKGKTKKINNLRMTLYFLVALHFIMAVYISLTLCIIMAFYFIVVMYMIIWLDFSNSLYFKLWK